MLNTYFICKILQRAIQTRIILNCQYIRDIKQERFWEDQDEIKTFAKNAKAITREMSNITRETIQRRYAPGSIGLKPRPYT